jgi:hypothetical protein
VATGLWVVDLSSGDSTPVVETVSGGGEVSGGGVLLPAKVSCSCVAWVMGHEQDDRGTVFFTYVSPKDPIPVLCAKALLVGATNTEVAELTPRTPPPLARKLTLPVRTSTVRALRRKAIGYDVMLTSFKMIVDFIQAG